jgi:hypothetical protein
MSMDVTNPRPPKPKDNRVADVCAGHSVGGGEQVRAEPLIPPIQLSRLGWTQLYTCNCILSIPQKKEGLV